MGKEKENGGIYFLKDKMRNMSIYQEESQTMIIAITSKEKYTRVKNKKGKLFKGA